MSKNIFTKYREPTLELILQLLDNAYNDELEFDKILQGLSNEVFKEISKILKQLQKSGKIDLNKKVNLEQNPAIYAALKHIEYDELTKTTSYLNWMGYNLITGSLTNAYKTSYTQTYHIFKDYLKLSKETVDSVVNSSVKITDTYITDHYLTIPWCQDGKIYSDRLYGHIANFADKLAFVLEEGLTNGKGMEWMMDAWQKLTDATAYDAARLLKTETIAMWSQATKDAYLDMGIEYVEITGDAACGEICTDYVGQIIRLEDAELGDELPPYHPNCACDYIAFKEDLDDGVEN